MCAIHEVVEPFDTDEAVKCPECFHVYANDEAILDQYKETYPNQILPSSADDVLFCPLCLHDW
jgi:hypothetical protein